MLLVKKDSKPEVIYFLSWVLKQVLNLDRLTIKTLKKGYRPFVSQLEYPCLQPYTHPTSFTQKRVPTPNIPCFFLTLTATPTYIFGKIFD